MQLAADLAKLLDDCQDQHERQMLAEAVGFVVVIHDPETGCSQHIGPYAKDDFLSALGDAARQRDTLNGTIGEGELAWTVSVHLLFAPEPRKPKEAPNGR
jgi:hypothetical protein